MNALPTTTPRLFCFVLMPFDESFNDIYHLGIKDSCQEAGAYCERVDEQIFHERILDRIYNQIAKADCIIADMTGRNPNVFYEVGYAHALGKPTILLTQRAEDIPFDLKHFPHIVYQSKLMELREQLTRRVRWLVENPPIHQENLRDDVQLYIKDKVLDSTVAMFECASDTVPHVQLTLRNASTGVFISGAIKAALISGPEFRGVRTKGVESISLPDGRWQHLLPDLPNLLPDEHVPIKITLNNSFPPTKEVPITVRIYTEKGPLDYPVLIKQTD